LCSSFSGSMPQSSSQVTVSRCMSRRIQGTEMAVQMPAQTKGTPQPRYVS
jgi:hypothetical protein